MALSSPGTEYYGCCGGAAELLYLQQIVQGVGWWCQTVTAKHQQARERADEQRSAAQAKDMEMLGRGREDAKRYLKCFTKRTGDGLQSKFPHINPDCIALLGALLRT